MYKLCTLQCVPLNLCEYECARGCMGVHVCVPVWVYLCLCAAGSCFILGRLITRGASRRQLPRRDNTSVKYIKVSLTPAMNMSLTEAVRCSLLRKSWQSKQVPLCKQTSQDSEAKVLLHVTTLKLSFHLDYSLSCCSTRITLGLQADRLLNTKTAKGSTVRFTSMDIGPVIL